MNKNLHIATRRFALMALMTICFLLGGKAQNKILIEPFSIAPGQTVQMPVILQNTDEVTSMQVDIQLPDGFTVDGKAEHNMDRTERETHTISVTEQGSNIYRLALLSKQQDYILGNDGPIAYIPVTAPADFTGPATIKLSEAMLSDMSDVRNVEVVAEVAVTAKLAQVTLGAESVTIKPDGSTAQTVSVNINSEVDVYGMQLVIKLPQGVQLQPRSSTRPNPKFDYGDLLSDDMSISAKVQDDGSVNVAISSPVSTDPFLGKSGHVFSFYLIADETMPATAELSLEDVKISIETAGGQVGKLDVDVENKVTLINAKQTYLDPANAEVDNLNQLYAEAVAKIEAEAADVKDSEAIITQKTAIEQAISNLAAAVAAAYADESLYTDTETVLAPVAEIKAAIEQLVADAEKAQAEHEQQEANSKAYERLTAQTAALTATFDEAKATIEETYAEVAADFTERINFIAEEIAYLNGTIETKYQNGELDEESTYDAEIAAIEESIQLLLEDAKLAYEIITGIETVEMQQGNIAVFDLSGKKQTGLKRGINIVKNLKTGAVKKVYIK